MKKIMEIERLQDLIVEAVWDQSENDKYATTSDMEYRINEALREIAHMLVRMVTK